MEVDCNGAVRRARDVLRLVQLLGILKKRRGEETAATAGKQKLHRIAQTGSSSIKRLFWARRNRTRTRRVWFQWCSSKSVGESPLRNSMVVRCLALRLSATLRLARSNHCCEVAERATNVRSVTATANITSDVGVEHRDARHCGEGVGGACSGEQRDAGFGRRTAGSRPASLRSAASRRLVDQVGLCRARRRPLVD